MLKAIIDTKDSRIDFIMNEISKKVKIDFDEYEKEYVVD